MKKLAYALAIAILVASGLFLYSEHRPVRVYDVHRGEFTAQILVDDLPWTSSAKIDWWLENEKVIKSTLHLQENNSGDVLDYYIYAYGEGYKIQGKQDEICFSDMATAKNCIEKNILMSVSSNPKGDTEFRIDNSIYIRSRDGHIDKVK
ncbi:DUF943 family protein [Franconibacter pulveris]|uniref:DUF943 family protein n=1 Tax=Franconibacter pulveris TaxID=435910 RepID=UPI00049552B5|nr:DUF943 family protein [Franconibacter pulveris]